MPAVSLVEAQTLGEKILMAHSVGQRNATLTIASLLRAEMEVTCPQKTGPPKKLV